MRLKKTDKKIHKKANFLKFKSALKRPILAIIILFIAFICFSIYTIIPDYSYKHNNGHVQFENPESFCTSENNWSAIVDGQEIIYCINAKDTLVYTIDANQFPYENAKIIDITFSSDDHLFCHIAVYNETAYLTDSESVFEIDTSGKILHEIIHYDYSEINNPPSHQTRLMGLHSYGEMLYYLYKEYNGYTIYEINPDNPQQNNNIFIANDTFSEITQCHGTPDGKFLILKNNGEIGFISYEGKYINLYKAEYDARTSEGIYPSDVFMTNSKLYMLEGQDNLSLYEWKEDDWKFVLSVSNNINMQEGTDLYFFGLGEYKHNLALHLNQSLFTLEQDSSLTPYTASFSLPSSVTILMFLKSILPPIFIIFLLFGIILGIGNLMKWRFTILSKQLFSTIPVVFIMLSIVIVIMFSSMITLSTEDILRETIAINEVATAQFNGDELATITNYESVDKGQIKDLNNQLRTFINGNKTSWSKNYNMAIYVRTTGEKFVSIASSDESSQFMLNSFSTDYPIHEKFHEDSHTFVANVSYGGDSENLYLVLVTPIYQADGSYNAVMMLSASQNHLTQELITAGKRLLINIILWGTLLIFVITLVSAHNAKSLKKAKNVVTRIAQGDFSLRVDKYSKDEIGEICVGVNDMADRLEQYINEKAHNEQFYYKFVPEKFRELLHKEKFTDLNLGDAQSQDLSILFCDIRTFSLNSEMMTTKEGFNFVNRIYGKAGPIIRKHNGFIDKYIGDAIMALFENADDAVSAGIELYQAIVQNPNSEKDFGIPSVKVGIGIHSGMARIGIVGEEERMSGTVISNTVNLSSRIESLTKKYDTGMIISKDTLDRMHNSDVLSTRYLGMVQVAGVKEVVALYEILDCLEPEKQQNRKQSAKDFKDAVRLFHTGKSSEALEVFQRLCKASPDDIAPQLYSSYIEDKLTRGDTKHNVFSFENK